MKSWAILLMSLAAVLGDGVGDRLHDDIFHDHHYNPEVIPMRKPKDPINVRAQLILLDASMDRKGSPLEGNVWVALQWEDYRLTWDPTQYEGQTSLIVPAKHLWLPDIEILNAYNYDVESFSARMDQKPGNAIILFNGTINWFPPNYLEVHCKESSPLDNPNEERRCSITMGCWTHMAKEIQLGAYNGNDFLQLEDFNRGSEFVITSQKGDAVRMKDYPEWGGEYNFLEYEFKLMRSYIPTIKDDLEGDYEENPHLPMTLDELFTGYTNKNNMVSAWSD